jgi:GTP:adenosylcobinamide-phosphate guanylyltransferase
MSGEAVDIVVLAADRGATDPVAAAGNAPGKVLVDVGGRPMLARVLDAVARAAGVRTIIVVCPDAPGYHAVLASAGAPVRIDPAEGPAASVNAALALRPDDGAVVVATGDHALLEPGWVNQFVERASACGADAVVGVVDHAGVARRFPDSRRTRYRFADIAVCGANLFYFADAGARRAVSQWQTFEAYRKRPWRIVAKLGPANLLRYMSGRLTLTQATEALSRRLGVRVRAVLIDDPCAAVDVDSPADLEQVRALCAAECRARS